MSTSQNKLNHDIRMTGVGSSFWHKIYAKLFSRERWLRIIALSSEASTWHLFVICWTSRLMLAHIGSSSQIWSLATNHCLFNLRPQLLRVSGLPFEICYFFFWYLSMNSILPDFKLLSTSTSISWQLAWADKIFFSYDSVIISASCWLFESWAISNLKFYC